MNSKLDNLIEEIRQSYLAKNGLVCDDRFDYNDEELQLAIVTEIHPELLEDLLAVVDNVTEKVLVEAVKGYGNVIEYISNPSSAVIEAAIESYPDCIEHIK